MGVGVGGGGGHSELGFPRQTASQWNPSGIAPPVGSSKGSGLSLCQQREQRTQAKFFNIFLARGDKDNSR